MVEFRGSYLKADPEYKQKSPFYSNNQTYLVNGHVSGIMFDILERLQNRLNFSTLLYKRKTESWGFIYPQSNGSFIGTGMVGDIFFQRADLIVAPLVILLKRALYIDYLPPVIDYFCGIYIPNSDFSEQLDLDTFIAPFTSTLWVTIFMTAIFIAIVKSILLFIHHVPTLIDSLAFVWTTFVTFFGGDVAPTKIDSKMSYKIIVLFSFLCGIVIWGSYNAALTAKLSVTFKKYPFPKR